MRAVIQRVSSSNVKVNGETTGSIGAGVTVLLGVHKEDTKEAAQYLAAKIADLRIFQDDNGKMNLSLKETGGRALVISQFTLLGDCAKGRRPSFIDAADPQKGKELYEYFVEELKKHIGTVETGVFGAEMKVELINDGPVTFVLER